MTRHNLTFGKDRKQAPLYSRWSLLLHKLIYCHVLAFEICATFAEENRIPTIKTVDNKVDDDKTIEELKNELVNTLFTTYQSYKNWRWGTIWLAITITHHRVLEGWYGKSKGLLQVLFKHIKINWKFLLKATKRMEQRNGF